MMASTSSYPAAGFPSAAMSDGCGTAEDIGRSTDRLPLPPASPLSPAVPIPADTSPSLRLAKRPLGPLGPHGSPGLPVALSADTCKKRRKQSTPIRISTTEASMDDTATADDDGKLGPFLPSSPNQSPRSTPTPTPHSYFTHNEPHLLHHHVKTEPMPTESEENSSVMMAAASQSLPSWMPDMQTSKPEDWLPLQGMGIGGPASMYLLNLHRSDLSPVQPKNPNQPPIRIFNPEAYCELCNKEFCNKYFLKTHKANKHRIYCDPPVSETSMNIPSFSAPAFKKTVMAVSTDSLISKTLQMDSTKPKTLYCDVCGKGYCNILLLKAHKTHAHRISCDVEFSAVVAGHPSPTMKYGEEEREPGQLDSVAPEEDSLPKSNSFFENGHTARMDVPVVKNETNLEQDEVSFNVANCKMSPTQIGAPQNNLDSSVNRLRRMGIMNPEAFCEICCKEYCNKYFLRTHKMKRHGILIPDDNNKDGPKSEQAVGSSWYQIQTSPLNLIMGEQNTNSSGSFGDRKSSPVSNECDICGMRFQTAYLAQLHASVNCKAAKEMLENDTESVATPENNTIVSNNNEKLTTNAADAISEDLQKLQTMILQLNDLGANKSGASTCHLCNKELENRYFLQAHMMTEHSIFSEENLEPEKQEAETVSETTACKLCGRDGLSADTFKQHMAECHTPAVTETKEDSNGFTTPDKAFNRATFLPQVPIERRSSMSLTPTSSYCEICNKELCNKYFMKTHMQRMHGIEIENGAQIGGVVCNICNKELCSKYFLRVHKHNTHGIVEEGAAGSTLQNRPTADAESAQAQAQSQAQSQPLAQAQQLAGAGADAAQAADAALKPDLADLSHRYFSHFTEVCSICSRRFRSTKWLKAHLLGDHGKAGADKWNELEAQLQQSFGQHSRAAKAGAAAAATTATAATDRTSPMLRIPNGGGHEKAGGHVQNVLSSLFGAADESNVKQYFCSFCSFSTPVLAFLFVHERSHARPAPEGGAADGAPLQCAVCSQSFRQPEHLHHHILSQHPFLPLGPFFGGGGSQPATNAAEAAADATSDPENRCSRCGHCDGGGGGGGQRTRACTRARPDEVSPELGSSLKDVSQRSQLPAAYALPHGQGAGAASTKYVMQAFLMDEPSADMDSQQQNCERRFAPSIVFLPVLERLNNPLTVSFSLTPA